MTREQLKQLHDEMTVMRDAAYKAYNIALKNRQFDGDAETAYEALLLANKVRDRVYRAIIESTASAVTV